ncbi:synaptonemal complex protein 1-like [Branchiostoma floridae]|uniref:Synaptonemal complex protein 1-like n=1 Tax=Branchiostoma floridae TaxID=7739 RepID=A0A9J7LV98_BRAFL|nr:synaptonemal complex protein 1-like [Branchiostoma floridae]
MEQDPFGDDSRPQTAFGASSTSSRSSTRMTALSATRKEHRSLRFDVGGTDNKVVVVGPKSNVTLCCGGAPQSGAHGGGSTDVNATFRQDTREYTSTPEGRHVQVQGTMTLRHSALRRTTALAVSHTESRGTNTSCTFINKQTKSEETNTTITLDQVERLLQLKEENIERLNDLPQVQELLNVTSDGQLKSENQQLKRELQNLKGEISKANFQLKAKETTIHDLRKKQVETERNNSKGISKTIEEKEKKIHELQRQVLTLERKIAEREGQEQECCNEAKRQLKEKDGIIEQLKEELQKRRKDVEDLCKAMRHQKFECKKHSTALGNASEKVKNLEESLDSSEKDLKKKEEHIQYLQDRIRVLRMGHAAGTQPFNRPSANPTRRTYPPPT